MLWLQKGHLDVVKFLVEKGANVRWADVCGATSLYAASYVCFFFLLKDNELINFWCRKVTWKLLNFCLRKALKLIKRAVKAWLLFGSHLKYDELVSLFFFHHTVYPNVWVVLCGLQNGYLDVVKFLIEKGAKVEQANNVGVTPLSTASQVIWILLMLLHNLSFF